MSRAKLSRAAAGVAYCCGMYEGVVELRMILRVDCIRRLLLLLLLTLLTSDLCI